ncbi:hypothetical protein [Rufibacter ruber]|uniref:hypothetical protein n=1 Tax=Rufibacter ruber TaxID=1783499 RepID=UPI00082EB3EB|nr:hypothetical protein [Rufibacter ruber]
MKNLTRQPLPAGFKNSKQLRTLQAYGQSKTASNLFALELDNRAKTYKARAYSVHPGSFGGKELGREAPLELFQQMGFCDAEGNMLPEVLASLKTIPQGAATTVWAATSPLLNSLQVCTVEMETFPNWLLTPLFLRV